MQLLTLPGNSKCADCHAPNPTWASTTFGMFICLNCSGIHRALGTHVTLVRSVELDTWTDDQASTMEHVGNVTGNQFWESKVPKNFSRPSPQDRAHLEKFIHDKYVGAVWAGSGFPPHKKTMPARTCSMGTITKTKGSGHVATGTPKFAKPMRSESGDEKVKKNAVVIAHKLVYGHGNEKKQPNEGENSKEIPQTEALQVAKKEKSEPAEKACDNVGEESGKKSDVPVATQPVVKTATPESATDVNKGCDEPVAVETEESGKKSDAAVATQPVVKSPTPESATDVNKGCDEVVAEPVAVETEERNEKEPPLPRFAKRMVEKHEVKATPVKIVDKYTGKPAPAKPVAQYVPPVRDVGSQQKSRFVQPKK